MQKVQYDELNLKKFKMKSILPDATILLIGKRRSGKCLLKGTKVLMYDGSTKNVEDIKKGDLVMGDDSLYRTVLETHSGHDTMYKITNQYNESYTVNSEHILSLLCTYNPKIKERDDSYKVSWFDKEKLKIKYKIFKIIENKENTLSIIHSFLKEKTSDIINIPIKQYMAIYEKIKPYLKGYQKPVYFKPCDTYLEPYLCGLLLNNSYKFTQNHKILCYLYKMLPLYNSYLYFNTHSSVYEVRGELASVIRNINPRDYIINSVTNRKMFLMGVLEGNNFFKRGYLDLSDSNHIDNICFLIKSLGYSIHKFNNNHIYIHNGHNIMIKQNDFFTEPVPKYIENDINIVDISVHQYYGFEVDGNHLYFLDNLIVTHNSWLVRDIFYHHKHIPSGIVFSGTEEANPFFGEFIPDCFIHEEYEAEIIEKIMNKQKKRIKDAKRSGVESGKTPANNVFIVFDDMLADAQNWKNDKIIKEIFFNGRHYNFLFILTMQYALAIPPGLRGNIDYVFVFNEPSIKNRRKIYEDYAAMIPSFDHFCNILDACTQNHECLVIKTSGNSSNLQDNIFWYKAEAHKDFRVGHYKLWKYHNKHYNQNYEEDNLDAVERVNDLKEKFSKTKKLKVIVSRQNDNIVDLKY